MFCLFWFFFFFSSRRRHTRWPRDWSSDVCSSDLVLFGGGDVLINNIAWLARRLPFFAVAGTGAYRVRPVFVDDVARLAVDAGRREDRSEERRVGKEWRGRGGRAEGRENGGEEVER